jgi:tRNA threonylcarbamoyladenosine biosynthesis protein TsaE
MDRSTAPAPARGALESNGPHATHDIGRALGSLAMPGTVLALVGELGAGKTHLAKGVAAGLGVRSVVNSPTFVLMNEHEGRLRMYHVDAYRLSDPEEAVAAGLIDERQADGVLVIEWADRLGDWLPEDRLEIRLDPSMTDPLHRDLRWTARGAAHERLATEALGSP